MSGRALGPGRLYRKRYGNGRLWWMLDFKDAAGKRHRKALSTDKGVAERLRAELIRERDLALAGLPSTNGQDRSLREIADAFLVDLPTRATSEHVRNTRAHLERMLRDLGVARVRDLAPHHVIAVRAKRIQEGASHQTAQHGVRSLKSALTWAVEAGLISHNPIGKLKRLKITERNVRRRRRALNDEEIARLLAAADEDDAAMAKNRRAATVRGRGSGGPRSTRAARIPQAVMLRAFVDTGARYQELTSTTWSDFDEEQRTLHLRGETTKNGQPRKIPLRAALVEELVALRALQVSLFGRPGPRIFLSPTGIEWPWESRNALRVLYRILERARITRRDEQGRCFDLHSLRKTCATRLSRRRVPVTTAQRLLGHSDVSLTAKHYVDVGLDEMRAAVEAAEPTKNTASTHVA